MPRAPTLYEPTSPCWHLQTFGLQLTGATRASFLIQAKSLFTPLLAALAGFAPSSRVRLGCGLALGGALLIAADKAEDADAGSLELAGLPIGEWAVRHGLPVLRGDSSHVAGPNVCC